MLKDITNEKYLIEQTMDGNVSFTEFIKGFRFTIKVGPNGITLTQDSAYNIEHFGVELKLDQLWSLITKNYQIDEENLKYAPAQYYDLYCIFFDNALNENVRYPGEKGVIVVEIFIHGSKGLVYQDRIVEFCGRIGLNGLPPIFQGPVHALKAGFQAYCADTKFALNKTSYGYVIKEEPCLLDGSTLDYKRYVIYTEPTNTEAELIAENAVEMAEEMVPLIVDMAFIIELENSTKISSTKSRTKFVNACLAKIKKLHLDYYDSYWYRCSGTTTKEDFDKLVKTVIKSKIDELVKSSPEFNERME